MLMMRLICAFLHACMQANLANSGDFSVTPADDGSVTQGTSGRRALLAQAGTVTGRVWCESARLLQKQFG